MTFEHSLLQKIGFKGIEHVRAEVKKAEPLTSEQVRRAMVRMIRKNSKGRGGLPEYTVATMFEDYRRLNSLAQVGKIYGRSRQAMHELFHSHGYELNARNFKPRIVFDGRVFTPGKNDYYRATLGDREPLHHAIWRHNHGPIPAGHQVTFRDGDKTNVQIKNLMCAPIVEVTLTITAVIRSNAHDQTTPGRYRVQRVRPG